MAEQPKKQILLLDDDEDMRALLPALLGNEYAVTAVTDWTEVNQHIFRSDFDLVLLDVDLPVLSGDKIAEVLSRTARKPVKIVLFSAMDEVELAARARTAGAAGYLRKQLDKQSLRRRVRELIDGTL
jgi:CheY-like chemotaxis protein